MTVARRMQMGAAGAGGGGGWNPLTAFSWQAAHWAEDSSWSNPGNGNAVSSWRDGTGGGNHLVQATSGYQPLYRSSVAALNNKPAVDFDGTDDYMASTSTFTELFPASLVIIFANHNPTGDSKTVFGGGVTGVYAKGDNYYTLQRLDPSYLEKTAVGAATDVTINYGLMVAYFNGLSSFIQLNGTTVTASDSGLTRGATSLTLSTAPIYSGQLDVAFVGAFNGDITAESGWSTFKSNVATHYGFTIS